MSFNASIVENAALQWFGELAYAVGHGPQLAPGEPAAERESFSEVVQSRSARTLIPAFSQREKEKEREAIRWPNPSIPEDGRTTIRQFRRVQVERRLKQ